jgi:hypothetical protein
MIEVGAGQTERTALPRERDPGVRAESFAALVAQSVAMRDEHFQLSTLCVLHIVLQRRGMQAACEGEPAASAGTVIS